MQDPVSRDVESDPGDQLDTIVVLYLPELSSEVDAYLEARRQRMKAGLALAREIRNAGTEKDASDRAVDKYIAEWGSELNRTTAALRRAARQLVVSIMGVDEQ
jgi:hypothetical protein